MGNVIEKYVVSTGYLEILRTFSIRKRKLTENENPDELEESVHVAKKRRLKKKLLSTPQYIYQVLFVDGTDSDITLIALGKEWKLHKVYLCQSPYFASMFSGSWKEANENIVHIKIIDPKITVDSLYTNALSYYNAALEYGVMSLKEASFNWLLANLLTSIRNIPDILCSISVDLMTALISSPNLFVVQTESSIYYLLQFWLYIILNPSKKNSGNRQQILIESSEYFQKLYDGKEFLLTEKGKEFSPPFRALRIQHLINLLDDMKRIKNDKIIPEEWLNEATNSAWLSLLKFDHGMSRGTRRCTEEEMNKFSLRCGRILPDDGEHMWRWTGFYSGLDLVWTKIIEIMMLDLC
ncbi:hypothetical protein Phum_PHUM264430 [Pediculus humanus corporis]|uniref:BTB domain-containing protein n=1 Tax=Pediculus humanus subsp. corporis TaxID=121224 RepID=E0VKI4_PEDHC|nr:uncharacterized protein Phum_PHUM264430 [Pediculus humanus corporis]EEB13890.1 hypothetical protein Phum_PHUM264430 [Pediculus humanus corporis]